MHGASDLIVALNIGEIMFNFLMLLAVAAVPVNYPPAPRGIPTMSEYHDALKAYGELVDEFDKEESYKDTEFKKIKDKKVVLFQDLPELQRFVFILTRAEEITKNLNALEEAWKAESAKVPSYPKQDALVEGLTQRYPRVNDMKNYLDQLRTLRKKMATKLEKACADGFEKHKSEIPAEEAKKYLNEIKDFHKQNQLVP
jgi:hypothetical protein